MKTKLLLIVGVFFIAYGITQWFFIKKTIAYSEHLITQLRVEYAKREVDTIALETINADLFKVQKKIYHQYGPYQGQPKMYFWVLVGTICLLFFGYIKRTK